MSTSFDFGALAADALTSHPDAALIALLNRARAIQDEMLAAHRRGERAYRKALGTHCRESVDLGERIASTPAVSREGRIEKARYALEGSRSPGTIEDTFRGIQGPALSALHDFLKAEDWA